MFRGAKFISLHAKCKEPRQLRSSSSEFGSEGSGLQPKEFHGSSTEFVSEEPSIQSKKSCLVLKFLLAAVDSQKRVKKLVLELLQLTKMKAGQNIFPFINAMSQTKQNTIYCCNTLKQKKRNCYTFISPQVAALLHELVSGHLGRHH